MSAVYKTVLRSILRGVGSNSLAQWLRMPIYYFISGEAFFIGAALILTAITASIFFSPRSGKIAANWLTVCGFVFMLLSVTPGPIWLYLLLGSLILTWLFLGKAMSSLLYSHFVKAAIIVVIAFWVISEARYWRTPIIPQSNYEKLYVIGDSISAGLRGDNITWPKVIQADHHIAVFNLARAGSTVMTAFPEIDGVTSKDGVILIEIGGNDLFKTPRSQFEAGLERILNKTRRLANTLVMLELPLPPFRNSIGTIQRKLAAKYNVILIPKRFFAKVACGRNATRDGLHLSRSGHERMADMIWSLIHPLFRPEDRD